MWTTALALLLLCISRTYGVDPLVLTKQGLVLGTRSSDGQYSLFLGIPFATVNPKNPFGNASPGPIFNTIFQANDDSAICPQRDEIDNIISGTLDCLHVNVYVPSSASTANPLPVMVWIFGGAFSLGSPRRQLYGPDFLIKHGVIVVTLNYRVGPYGFMCLDIPSVPGNQGLKDQQLALRWISENIAAFGGDTSSITVFGESAGAMSIGLHLISPGSKGLFHRAIMQSGSALVEGIIVHSKPSAPLDIAKHLGLNAETIEEAIDIIKQVPTDDIIKASDDLGLTFKPCVEKTFEGVTSFLDNFPDIILKSAQYENIPILIGYNNAEQLGIYITQKDNDIFFNRVQNIFYNRINASFEFISEEQAKMASEIVQQFYIGTKVPSTDVLFEMSDFDTDMHFVYPTERFVSYLLSKSDAPIFQYILAYTGGLNFARRNNNITEGGALHGDDLGYIFKQIYTPEVIDANDQIVIDRLTKMWTNFAKYSNPTPQTSDLLTVQWLDVTQDSREYLHIDKEFSVQQKPFHDRVAFWDLFFVAFGEYFSMVWEATRYDVY